MDACTQVFASCAQSPHFKVTYVTLCVCCEVDGGVGAPCLASVECAHFKNNLETRKAQVHTYTRTQNTF
eukprot:1813976-Amphidinium_carterae.1